jgi:hypothetical protein
VEGAGDGQGHSVAGSPGSVTRTRLLASIYGDSEAERRTHPDLALDPDLAAVQFHELPTQGQSEVWISLDCEITCNDGFKTSNIIVIHLSKTTPHEHATVNCE